MTQTETNQESRQQLETGEVLRDRYEIRGVLGQGGFAVIYHAFDQTIERRVAIKVLNLHDALGSQDQVEQVLTRFRREARLAARIRHPSVVEIHDFGVLDGSERPFMIMEFLEGTDLEHEIVDNGPMQPDRLFPLYCDALDALGEAHNEGVVHKDLKPANLFLTHPGTRKETLKLVDFGIAHVNAPGEKRMTKTGLMAGTPQYLPPEYVEEQRVSEKMDIYQMGLILVEALTGEPCVQASSPFKAAFKHVERDLLIPPQLWEGEFGAVLETAIAYDPSDRYETAEAFADALAGVDPSTIPRLEVGSPDGRGPVSPVADTGAGRRTTARTGNNIESEEAFAQTLAGAGAAAEQPGGAAEQQGDTAAADSSPDVQLRGPMRDSYEAMDSAQRAEASSEPTHRESGPISTLNEMAATPGFQRWALIGGIGFLACAVLFSAGLVFLVLLQQQTQPESDATDPTAAPSQQPAEQQLAPEPALAQQEEPAEEEPTDDADAPTLHTVELLSEPEGALIEKADGTELGTAPMELELEPDEQLDLQFSYDDHEPETITVDASADEQLETVLERVPEPEPQPEPRPTPRPAPEPEPEPQPDPEPRPSAAETDQDDSEPEPQEEQRQLQLAP